MSKISITNNVTRVTVNKESPQVSIATNQTNVTVNKQIRKVVVTPNQKHVTVNKVIRRVLVTPNQTNVTVSKTGSQGLPGNSWIDVAGDVEYTGVDTNIASGEVLTCAYKSDTIYRFINSTENVNGYPIEDSFYSNFDGTNLTNLIVSRG
tara:strand:- start:16559 stop:17008 length:450 start_codon:yes stop_codon:yes gene_type:complete